MFHYTPLELTVAAPPPDTKSGSMNRTTLRHARMEDVDLILELIRGLAEFENLSHQVQATREQLQSTLFEPGRPLKSFWPLKETVPWASPCSSPISRRFSENPVFTSKTSTSAQNSEVVVTAEPC